MFLFALLSAILKAASTLLSPGTVVMPRLTTFPSLIRNDLDSSSHAGLSFKLLILLMTFSLDFVVLEQELKNTIGTIKKLDMIKFFMIFLLSYYYGFFLRNKLHALVGSPWCTYPPKEP